MYGGYTFSTTILTILLTKMCLAVDYNPLINSSPVNSPVYQNSLASSSSSYFNSDVSQRFALNDSPSAYSFPSNQGYENSLYENQPYAPSGQLSYGQNQPPQYSSNQYQYNVVNPVVNQQSSLTAEYPNQKNYEVLHGTELYYKQVKERNLQNELNQAFQKVISPQYTSNSFSGQINPVAHNGIAQAAVGQLQYDPIAAIQLAETPYNIGHHAQQQQHGQQQQQNLPSPGVGKEPNPDSGLLLSPEIRLAPTAYGGTKIVASEYNRFARNEALTHQDYNPGIGNDGILPQAYNEVIPQGYLSPYSTSSNEVITSQTQSSVQEETNYSQPSQFFSHQYNHYISK